MDSALVSFSLSGLQFKQRQFLAEIHAHCHQSNQHYQGKKERRPMQQQNRKISHKQAGQERLVNQSGENFFENSNPVSHVGIGFDVEKRLLRLYVK
jgi:hypothetical protein